VIGPSNPVIWIGPIIAIPEMREAIGRSSAPVVAVSPLVAGRSVKGPSEAFIAAVGRPVSAAGVASLYSGLLDAMVVDAGDPDPGLQDVPVRVLETMMSDESSRRALAADVIALARELA